MFCNVMLAYFLTIYVHGYYRENGVCVCVCVYFIHEEPLAAEIHHADSVSFTGKVL